MSIRLKGTRSRTAKSEERSRYAAGTYPLANPFEVVERDTALPVCDLIARLPFSGRRGPRQMLFTKNTAISRRMLNCSDQPGCTSSKVRIGLMACCRIANMACARTCETIMLAGSAFEGGGRALSTVVRRTAVASPSMVRHATKTRMTPMSIYIWDGDIATDEYRYFGLPEDVTGSTRPRSTQPL